MTWLVVLAIVVSAGAFAYTQLAPPSRTLTFKLYATEYAFSDGKETNPTITVKVGDTVNITVRNVGKVEHEFMIVQDLNASISHVKEGKGSPTPAFGAVLNDIDPDEEDTMTFKADKPGTYYYVCLADDPEIHAKLGMFGKFIVLR